MKKICFISLTNVYLTPYFKKYENLLDCPYDFIYWNRDHISEETNADNMYSFELNNVFKHNKLIKFIGYIAFRRYALSVLHHNVYSGIIILHNQAGILLKSYLLENYRNRYLFDIRDFTFENSRLYFKAEKKLTDNAGLNIISSNAYREFLPNGNYIINHNECRIDGREINKYRTRHRSNQKKIVISSIGLIRFQEQNKKIALAFKNDERFELRFIGTGANELATFCSVNKINNVVLKDSFLPSESIIHFSNTDVILNLYGNDSPSVNYALSNRLYYAAKLGMPILVCPGTYMEKIAKENGFGYTIDLNNTNVADDFYRYYCAIQWNTFRSRCDEFIKKVEQDNLIFIQKVRGYINGL